MPAGRRDQPQGRRNGGSAGSLQGARDQAREGGQGLQEGAQQLGQQIQEGYDSAREAVGRGYRQAEGMMARHPGQSVLIGFGVGFGLGLLLTILLTQREETWYERHVPDSLRDLPETLRRLPGRISRNLPSSLSR